MCSTTGNNQNQEKEIEMEHIRQLCSQFEFGLISESEWAACMIRLIPDDDLRITCVEELISSDQAIIDLVA